MSDNKKYSEFNVLIQILEEVKKISVRLKAIETSISHLNINSAYTPPITAEENSNVTVKEIFQMPSSLDVLDLQESRPGIFRTYKALQKEDDWVKSSDISSITRRSRGLESRYLNYLADNNFCQKKRVKIDPEGKATEVLYRIIGADE